MSQTVFHSLEEARGNFGPCSLAIGNFDGVHIGHKALLHATRAFALANDLQTAVLTFHPHPTVLVAPSRVPPMLCTLEQRIARLVALGVQKILVLPFTEELALLTPEEFIAAICSSLETKGIFVGDNFRFGHGKAGTTDVLAGLGAKHNFATTFLERLTFRGKIVSSSAVRLALSEHRLALAGHLLGRCFSVEGTVVAGQGIGSKQTVPTLNLRPHEGQLELRGVYVTQTFDLDNGRSWPSITNAGVRPTFGGGDVTIETFLLGPLVGETPQRIRVDFHHYLRPEKQFSSPQELKEQIFKDVARARVYWRRVQALKQPPAWIY
jgi:riboflavin kinase / FMN adenylyltransferase